MRTELARAKFVVHLDGYLPAPVFERAMAEMHFAALDLPELRHSIYTIWQRRE
jgi:hypothetical protein